MFHASWFGFSYFWELLERRPGGLIFVWKYSRQPVFAVWLSIKSAWRGFNQLSKTRYLVSSLRKKAGGPVSYLSHYLLDFYFTESIFILHNLLLLDSISFLLDSKSTFIRRSRAKHFGYYLPFFDHHIKYIFFKSIKCLSHNSRRHGFFIYLRYLQWKI